MPAPAADPDRPAPAPAVTSSPVRAAVPNSLIGSNGTSAITVGSGTNTIAATVAGEATAVPATVGVPEPATAATAPGVGLVPPRA